MKIREISVEGLRGCPRQATLKLEGQSVSVLAENGFGKTTFADACELWSIGDLTAYHTQGAGLDAAVSLDADKAVVDIKPVGHSTMRRTLEGRRVGPLEVQGPKSGGETHFPGPIPLLRHRTMTEFMDNAPGAKKQALLKLLGLEELLDFRTALASGARRAKARAKVAGEAFRSEELGLSEQLADEEIGNACSRLSRTAGISPVIQTERDLLAADLASFALAGVGPRPALFSHLVEAIPDDGQEAVETWNRVVAEHDVARQLGLQVLLSTGQEVLEEWPDDSCPLCLTSQDRADLSTAVRERAEAIARSTAALTPAREALAKYGIQMQKVAGALDAIRAAPPQGGWVCAEDIEKTGNALAAVRLEIDHALVGRPYDTAVQVDFDPLLTQIDAAIKVEQAADEPARARAVLTTLRDQCRRVRSAERTFEIEETVSASAGKMLEIADAKVKETIQAELGRLSSLIGRYYGRLHGTPFYSDVQLLYSDAREGGVEFSFRFKGREITPPRRIMSESQLGSLGLALFLAELKLSDGEWETVILDDVVNSFDANHRSGLARLLCEEFSYWQVVLFTHDQVFHRLLEREATMWRFMEIVQWDPAGGPVLSVGDPRTRLRTQLDAGVAASQLHGHARHALESALQRPFAKLGLRISYKANSAYTAFDYLKALREALDGSGGNLIDLPILKAMDGRAYVGNLSSHYRPDDPGLGTQDLRQLLDDLEALDLALKCDQCDEMVWYRPQPGKQGHFQCDCDKLAV